MDPESKTKKLFKCAMRGEWRKVIEMYEQDARLHKARITRYGGTALHIAVSEGKEDVVQQMVHAIISQKARNEEGERYEESIKALRTHNYRKNTALHLAAFMGNARICHIIATVEPTLVDDRNVEGETPLFLAARFGRKQAFICLHFIRNPPHTTDPPFTGNCRRNDGDTILHSAIKGDYFDLAFQIIHLYKELANSINEEGLSPLHLLASKPCAFRSGSRLGRVETLIYNCLYVEELKEVNSETEHQNCPSAVEDCDGHDRPENYNTLWDALLLIRKAVIVVMCKLDKDGRKDLETGGMRRPNEDSEKDLKTEGMPGPNENSEKDPTNKAKAKGSQEGRDQANPLFPPNYNICCRLIKFFFLLILIILGKGSEAVRKIYQKKESHTWCVQIVEQLLHHASLYEYEDNGGKPHESDNTTSQEDPNTLATSVEPPSTKGKKDDEKNPPKGKTESPLLVAAKNGVMEIIERIVELFPVALHDLNEDKKNIVLLAVEHRQPHVYQFLLKKNIYKESLFQQLDKDGNSVLHLAATFDDEYKPWVIPGEALQLQWELKWYKFVNEEMAPDFFVQHNNNNETPDIVFTRTHKRLREGAAEWLKKTSESCSLVATLIAAVAFATAATVPGGVVQETGHPTLEYEPAFQLFAISSLVALACSITAMVMFLSIMTSRFQEQDFDKGLHGKLLIGLTSLFMSIASMLVSFCAGHFFVLKDTLHYMALPLYVVTCFPVTLFVLAQFPLYFDLLWAAIKHVPQRSYRPTA